MPPDTRTVKVEDSRQTTADDAWWHLLGVLYRWKRFILVTTFLFAAASIAISLTLTNQYRASSRLLLPEGSSGGLGAALLGDLSSVASSVLGASSGDYVRYMAILSSRTIQDAAIDSFDLINVYELTEEEFPRQAARTTLDGNIDVTVDDEFEYLSISVLDTSPQRAADLANYLLRSLDRMHNELSSRSAGLRRSYVEDRYDLATRERSRVLDSLMAFQQQYGVISLEAQTEAYFSQLAELRAFSVQAEIQYETLRRQFTDSNASVVRAKRILDASEQVFQQSLAGRERVFPVSEAEAPAMVKRFLELEMERTIQETVLEFIAPVLEQARLEEQRQVEVLQVVDVAIPPVRKAWPKRSVIVVAATLSGFILAAIFALLMNWWQTNHGYFFRRLNEAANLSAHKRP